MPEGPSIVILKEEVRPLFTGKEIIAVEGNAKVDIDRLLHQKVIAFKSWGKHFLICLEGFTVRIHLLMFGSYRVNERKSTPVRLGLTFEKGELNFYTCSVKFLEGDIDSHYDWSADVMNDVWNPKKAKTKLETIPEKQVCDALLEQDIFSGVGNIIKNEVLFRIKVRPESLVGKLSRPKINQLVTEARHYSFQFLEWKQKYELKKHWLAHSKKICVNCGRSLVKKITGIKKRRSFFCTHCQKLYL